MAAALPFKYMGAVSFGSGMSGLVCNLLRALTLVIFKPNTAKDNSSKMAYYSAILFLSIASLTLILCTIVH